MTNILSKVAFSAIILLSTNCVVADQVVGSNYLGAQYAKTAYNNDGASDETNPVALVGRLGVNVTNSFSIEGRLGLGLQDDTVSIFGTNEKIAVESLVGVYVLAHMNIIRELSVYGLLGLSRAEVNISTSGITVSDFSSGLSFGIGSNMEISNGVEFNIEYLQYLGKSDFDLNAIAIGMKLSF